MVTKLELIDDRTVLCAMTQENKRDSTLFWIDFLTGRELSRLEVPCTNDIERLARNQVVLATDRGIYEVRLGANGIKVAAIHIEDH